MKVAQQFETTEANTRGLASTSIIAYRSVHSVKTSGPVSMAKGNVELLILVTYVVMMVTKRVMLSLLLLVKLWKCGRKGHFAKRCPTKSTKTKLTNWPCWWEKMWCYICECKHVSSTTEDGSRHWCKCVWHPSIYISADAKWNGSASNQKCD